MGISIEICLHLSCLCFCLKGHTLLHNICAHIAYEEICLQMFYFANYLLNVIEHYKVCYFYLQCISYDFTLSTIYLCL